MEIDLNRDARDGDAERVAAPQSNRAVGVEVVAQEGNGDGGMVAAAEGVGAAPETVGVGASEGVAPEKNGVGSGGEKEVASEGSGAGAEVGAAVETNGVAVDVWICHQCRQRKTGLTAACRGSKKNGKCTLRYCKNCIRNRYPLIADEVLKEEAWECPKCRNDCNCSKCKKRRGEEPAGPMVHSVKRPKGDLRRIESTDALKDEIVIPRGTLVKRPKGNLRRIESTDALKDEIVIPRGTLVKRPKGNLRRIESTDALKDEIVIPRGTLVKRPKGNLRRIESTDALKDEIVIPRGTLVKRPKGNLRRIESTDALKDEIVIPRGTLVKRPKGNLRRIESTDALKDEIVIPRGTLVKRPKGNLRRIESTDALKDEIVIPRGTLVKRPKGNLRRIESTDALKDEIVIPRGTLVTCVAGVEMQPEDVGAAIQFLEFCRSFGEIFQIRKGQSEKIVKDITGDRQLREVSSVVAELHTNLLSVIENGNYKPLKYPKHGDTWIRKLSKYITDSTLHAKDFILDCLSHGLSGYKNLSPSHKLDVLNSLCDEALSSEKLRTRIEAREGVARQKIRAATEKEKELKERQNDMAKTMGGEITGNEEANNIFCQIKEAKEVKQAAMKELEELGCVLRSTPVMVDKGVAYWKLDGYCNNNTNILRQEFDKEATMKNQDKWFMFSEDEQKVVENHVTTRSQRPWRKDNRV
ncbi:uncharacterized protein LOC125516109 isoform X2 [Triticum urartu]|uniref:uncharacterized protein LOC125516109 isoform X2 n=1 Tax=Triticum urartu TaxID=4572 RepID=UPI002044CA6E|nr:uncharacterized protein LOC125516109 isoform X2 [Triticum urartu]